MTEHQALVCPFCGDRFEGRTSCPAHELPLVPYDRLERPHAADGEEDDDVDAPEASVGVDDTRLLSLLEPRYGRAQVAIAAALLGAAMPLGLVRTHDLTLRTYEVAGRLPSLWTWPLVGFCALYLLCRRRTPRALRGLRVVVPWLGFIVLLTLGLAIARLGGDVRGPAAFGVGLAGVLLGVAGLRLGGVSTRA